MQTSVPYGSYGSYRPATQVGMPPYTYHMDQSVPTQQMMQPMMPNRVSQPLPITDQPLLPTNLLEAENQSCAEEGSSSADDEKSGAEDKAPNPEYTFFGVDFQPFLLVALALSTVLGGVCLTLLQIPMLARFTFLPKSLLLVGVAILFAVTLACMVYCAFADPGQMRKTRNLNLEAGSEKNRIENPYENPKNHVLVRGNMTQKLLCPCRLSLLSPAQVDIEEGLPKRAHQSRQYPRPIRRYDHYCKWLQNVPGWCFHLLFTFFGFLAAFGNGLIQATKTFGRLEPCSSQVIGLLNHREFALMLIGLVLIGILGVVIDLWLAVLIGEKGFLVLQKMMFYFGPYYLRPWGI